MQLTILHTLEELLPLAGEWNELLRQSASHVPFLRHEYQVAWWQTLGGGEWPSGELYVAVAREVDARLVGIAPLFLTTSPKGEPTLMLLGSHEISDYLDVLARLEDLPRFTAALLDHLASPLAPPWKNLDLYNLLDSSPTLPALEAAALDCGWILRQEKLQHCPYIPLPGNWDTYLAGIDKKQRHEIRRKVRRLEEQPVPTRWYFADDEAALDREVDSLLDLMAQDPEKAAFLTGTMRAQMHATVHAAYHGGWLQLAILEIGGQKAAAYLNFDFDNQIWVYNSGLEAAFRELSPGWVLLGYLLRWANEHGRSAFDFMRGDEDYKYRFGAVDRSVMRATIRR